MPQDLKAMTAGIVTAYLGKNEIAPERIPDVIQSTFTALHNLNDGRPGLSAAPATTPAAAPPVTSPSPVPAAPQQVAVAVAQPASVPVTPDQAPAAQAAPVPEAAAEQAQQAPEKALAAEPAPQGNDLEPAVPIEEAVTPEAVICLECGATMKTLKRHLETRHKMSVDQYRHRWNLSPDFPLVAPNYAEERANHARRIGLGASNKKDVASADTSDTPAPKRGRPRKP